MESPEPPVFCTPGLKITKSQRHALSPPLQGEIDPESPCRLGNHQATPEVPAFETPYINRLLSTRKVCVTVSRSMCLFVYAFIFLWRHMDHRP